MDSVETGLPETQWQKERREHFEPAEIYLLCLSADEYFFSYWNMEVKSNKFSKG